ncbi:MAG: PHP domain-containing protein, partial [Planctomycetota bacterium]
MFDYDFHIHTELCGHAPGQTVKTIIEKTKELGLKMIAVTEHVFGPSDLKKLDIIRQEIRKHDSSCQVVIGAEVDVDRTVFDGRLTIEHRHDIDYILGTIHYLPGTEIMPHCEKLRPLGEKETFERWRSTLLGLVANPLVDTLAHPGAMIANAMPGDDFSNAVLDTFAQAAGISAKTGMAWELNNLTGWKLTPAQKEQYHTKGGISLTPVHTIGSICDHGRLPANIDGIGKAVFIGRGLSGIFGSSS